MFGESVEILFLHLLSPQEKFMAPPPGVLIGPRCSQRAREIDVAAGRRRGLKTQSLLSFATTLKVRGLLLFAWGGSKYGGFFLLRQWARLLNISFFCKSLDRRGSGNWTVVSPIRCFPVSLTLCIYVCICIYDLQTFADSNFWSSAPSLTKLALVRE